MGLSVGEIIDGKYKIIRLLGEGGMGSVYEGENTRIRRRVAIKVLNSSLVTNPEVLARFEREAQAAGQIGNDHILEVLDLGSLPSGERYMVLEYLDGETLAQRMQRLIRMTPAQLVPLARQFLSALGAAHAAGIIHRDLKPENIFILRGKAGRPDFVKLIDFGVSKFNNLGPDAFRVTRAGTIVGTPVYMSPEQARGTGDADQRSDIYAVGVILYEAVTSKLPFDDVQSFNDLMFKIALEEPPPPRSRVPDLDPAFEAIIMKAMAREAAKRYATVDELATALEEWANERQVPLSIAPPRISRASAADLGSSGSASSPRSFPAAASDPSIPSVAAAASEGLAATIANETPPGIESTILAGELDDVAAALGTSKKTKILIGALGAAALIGLVLIVVALSSSSTSASAAGLVGSASASAGKPPPPTTDTIPEPPPPTVATQPATTPSATTSATGSTPGAATLATRPTSKPLASTKPASSTKPTGTKPNKPSSTDFGY